MDIAIIGVSLKLPNNINSLEDLYNKLKNKEDCVTEHPSSRFDIKSYYGNGKGKINTKRSGYLRNIYNFDNSFFKILKKEAKTTDPQQRIMLELVYEALQSAKIKLKDVKNTKTGVFIGSCNTEYFSKQGEDPNYCNEYSITGGLLTLLSNRISYFYDLKGPSMTLDTACSSSGYALHLACQSIIKGESDQCIVGGSNLILNPETTVGFSQGKFLSPDGKCKSFDDSANGYVRSEGCVILLLKPLDKAVKDGNEIYSIIKNTSVNQDGKTNSITSPNGKSQIDLLNEVYKNIDINDVMYIEAHGTGTKIGDKTETNSIGTVFKNKNEKIKIGSIKSNIGHTEATSGLASICKIICMMKYNELLPNIHFNTPSTNIDFENLNLEVVNYNSVIDKLEYYMGVNNYGFGGANFHAILQNYVNQNLNIEKNIDNIDNNNIDNIDNKLHLLMIYGPNEESIDINTNKFLDYDDKFLEYVYNQNYSDKLDEAKIYILEDKDDFETQIFNPNKTLDLSYNYGKFSNIKPNICFVYCGQGPQHIDMGIRFMEHFPIFRDKILECDSIWKEISGYSFIEKYGLFKKNNKINYDTLNINDPQIAQPSITFFQIALTELYKSFNIIPDSVIGHSAGEQAAFFSSGSLSLKDTIKLSYYRSIYQQKTAGNGNMLVINDSIQQIDNYLKDNPNLDLAAVNSENSFVLAGDSESIDNLKEALKSKNIISIKIRGSCAFHSRQQEIIKDDIIKNTKDIKFLEPEIELISSVTGFIFDSNDYTNDYWWKNIRNTVRFKEGIEQCSNIDIFIEIAPHIVLKNNINEIYPKCLVLNSDNRKEHGERRFYSTLSKLYFAGCKLNLEKFGKKNNQYYHKYCWNRELFYQEPIESFNRRNGIINKVNYIKFNTYKELYIRDHKIGDKLIFPTVGYLDIIRNYFSIDDKYIKNLYIHNMLEIRDDYIIFEFICDNNKYELFNKNNRYLSFELIDNKDSNSKMNTEIIDYINNIKTIDNKLEKSKLIEILKTKNFNFGKNMFSFENGYLGNNENILVDISNKYNFLHETIIDICLTSVMMIQGLSNNYQYLPHSIDKINFVTKNIPKYIYTENYFENKNNIICNSYVLDKDYNFVCILNNIRSTNVTNNITSLYTPKLVDLNNKNIELLNTNIVNKELIEFISNSNLLEIRDILLKNEYKIYCIDISLNYEIVGFIRSIINEIKDINFNIIYFETKKDLELLVNTDLIKENLLLENYFINGKFMVMEIEKYEINNSIAINDYYLSFNKKGNISNLNFRYNNIRDIENNEVLIDIKYSSLNFKDLAVIHNLIESDGLGYEFSGIVNKSNSELFKCGDEVFGTIPEKGNCIGSRVICNENYIWLKPNNLNLLQSSAIGLSYSTSYLCLIDYANISKDDLVLIHSASGALGLAALEICKYIGCKVIATTSSEEKIEYLRNNYTNIVMISNSRDYNIYKKEILKYTKNEGVDVILFSSTIDHLNINLELLKPKGRLLDVGKRNIYEEKNVPLKYFIKSIEYKSVHFDKLMETNNKYIRNIVNNVIKLFQENKVNIFPVKEYNLSDYKTAFQNFSKSNHIGKFVLKNNNKNINDGLFPNNIFNNKKYYLITGGLGGLGIKLIKWMKIYGAKKFLITTRSINNNLDTINNLKKNIGNDTSIDFIESDLLDKNILEIKLSDYDIDGVFHLAGNTNDKMAKNIIEEDLRKVLDVKIEGIKNLGYIFKNREHRFFVAFSSIVSLIGNPGQSLYSAANSFMDRYCEKRTKDSLPGLSINLGAIGGCGMIGRDFNLTKTMVNNGIDLLVYHDLFEKMKYCLLDTSISQICITNQDWNKIDYLNNQIFKNMLNEKQKIQIVKNYDNEIIEFVKKLLDVKEIDNNKNLLEYGIDSIMSMEIANYCNNFNYNIKQIDILQGISINSILNNNSNSTIINTNINDSNSNKFYFESKRNADIEIDTDIDLQLNNMDMDGLNIYLDNSYLIYLNIIIGLFLYYVWFNNYNFIDLFTN